MSSKHKLRRRIRRPVDKLWRFASSGLRQRPDFIIIGVVKGGTSSLYRNLYNHPMFMPSAYKELHFFNSLQYRGLRWYYGMFPFKYGPRALSKRFKSGRLITGEGTPRYILYPHIPRQIHKVLPNTKFIVMLRNPVARAYSHLQMDVRDGKFSREAIPGILRTELDYHRPLTIDRAVYQQLFMVWAHMFKTYIPPEVLAQELPGEALPPQPFPMQYLLSGMYYEQLSFWFECFPREQFLIIRSEDYFANSRHYLEQVVPAFLGISQWELSTYVPANENFSYPEIDPGLKRELAEFFEPYNHKLYDLLGVDYGW